MDLNYKFTMSLEDQKMFLNIDRNCKYEELLNGVKHRVELNQKDGTGAKQIDFKEQSSSKFVLSQIDKKIMQETINAFPINLPLNERSLYTYPKAQSNLQATPDKIYDVRFIMPLLYHSVSPSLFVDCRDFIAKRCLALTITGLSSEDQQMRALCYVTLERYYHHLESALMIDASLWKNLLDLLRNSIPRENARLRYLFTTFICKIIDVLLHPEKDKLFGLMTEFLAGRPRLNIDTIEIYDDLLLCSDVTLYKYNLRWLVTLFRDGIRSKNDLKVLADLNVISQIMCLYNSELRFDRANETICSVFIRIVGIENGAKTLIQDFSFLPWLQQTILDHIDQNFDESKNDSKSESLCDTAKSISSLVFALVDSLMKRNVEDEVLPLTRLLELISVFIILHDLIIKSKNASILEYYLNYVRKVAKAIRKHEKIPDEMATHLLDLIRLKMPYLS